MLDHPPRGESRGAGDGRKVRAVGRQVAVLESTIDQRRGRLIVGIGCAVEYGFGEGIDELHGVIPGRFVLRRHDAREKRRIAVLDEFVVHAVDGLRGREALPLQHKAAAALLVRPNRSLSSLAGLLKVRRRIPPFIAVPTTAGTGSETTIAAVITGRDHRKYAVSDLCLIPRYAILDPTLSAGLPPHITAETGMDALTHAVEAYLSRFYNTRKTREQAERAVVTIFSHLERAYRDGASLPDRAAMLQASFDAGAAFTRASVGNVHAIAHTLGGLYGTAHGLANAVLLPIVLEDYGAAAYPRLARLAHLVGIQEASAEASARAFIAEIRAMNARMGIPDHFDCIRSEDIPLMASWACREANPVYPVPVIYDQARFARVIERSRAEP